MVEHDEQTEQVLNSQFAEYLRNKGASPLDVIVETEPGTAQQVAEEISGISGAELGTAGIIGAEFVAVSLPSEALPALTRLRNVVKVHYDQPVGIKEAGRGLPQLPFLRPENDPIGASISNAAFKLAKVEDKYVGEVGISEVEVPQVNATPLPPGNPAQALASGLDHAFGLGITGEEYIPTEESVKWIRDSNMLDAHDGADTKVAVIDTGHTPIPPANGGRSPHLESMVPGEPPQDMHGHGCASPGTKVHTTLTGIDTMKGVWNALSERCEVSDLDAGVPVALDVPFEAVDVCRFGLDRVNPGPLPEYLGLEQHEVSDVRADVEDVNRRVTPDLQVGEHATERLRHPRFSDAVDGEFVFYLAGASRPNVEFHLAPVDLADDALLPGRQPQEA